MPRGQPRQRPEEALQRACADFLTLALPHGYWTAIPNQRGTRKRWEMGILKAMGVRAGAGDFIIFVARMFIVAELKAGSNGLSPEQYDTLDMVTINGGFYVICRSVDDLQNHLLRLGVALRARCMGAGFIKSISAMEAEQCPALTNAFPTR